MHQLTKAEARRIAVRAQLLDARPPTDLVEVVRQLTLLQIDPTAAIAPSADLVAWSRLGSDVPAGTTSSEALEQDRTLFEQNALVPADEGPRLVPRGDGRPGRRYGRTRGSGYANNEPFRRDVLERLGSPGRCLARHPGHGRGAVGVDGLDQRPQRHPDARVPDDARRDRGLPGGVGRQRLWDLAERVYPADVVVCRRRGASGSERAAAASLGIARRRRRLPIEPVDVGDAGEPAVGRGRRASGASTRWRSAEDFEGRTALLSPFDRLVYDRARAQELFEFEYALEMYKPKAKRRWGYFALPVLHDDRLVGQGRRHRRSQGGRVLRVHAIHEDVKFTRTMTKAVQAELDALASWLGLGGVEL